MSSIKRKPLPFWRFNLVLIALSIAACQPGIQSGNLSGQFAGLQTARAVSPTAVVLNWTKIDDFPIYEVYSIDQKSPITESVFSSVTIDSLTPDTEYTFKVTAKESNGVGGNVQYNVKTWPRFQGIERVYKNSDGGMVVEWKYDYPVDQFQIFYQANSPPTAQSTNDWANPNATSNGSSHIFKGLSGSTTYYFTVHARYRQNEYERPEKNIAGSTNSSFPPVYFELPAVTIGSLPTIEVTPVITDQFLGPNYTSRVYKDGIEIADPIRGAGKATFASTIPLPLGKIDNISLEVTYKDSKINETLVLPGLSTYLKGPVPYLDLPPIVSEPGPAFMGRSTVSGDFNCDGYDDLAVGLPYVTLAQFGVVNRQSGAVYIYYGGFNSGGRYILKTSPDPAINPANPGKDPQILTFPDLSTDALFGFTLAKGNLNGDFNGIYPCDDLAVGAPYQHSPEGGQTGNAFVFFGTANVGIRSPATISAFPQNAETCDGRLAGASCSAVRLWPDHRLWPKAALGGNSYSPSYYNDNQIRYGAAIAFVGDFNADGSEDLAIGAPDADWDGVSPTYLGDPAWSPDNVGYVAMYFGSRFGLGFETPDGNVDRKFRWIKIYPPIVQPGMRFGSSIAAGDLDGAYRVFNSDSQYVGGSDIVIGAPNFTYKDPRLSTFPMRQGSAAENESVQPIDGGWWGNSIDDAAALTNPRYGFSQTGTADQGVAFAFFGRSLAAHSTNPNSNNPRLEDFWECGQRGMLSASTHYSCLARSEAFRILFPRDNSSLGFGTSVAVLGDQSARDSEDNLKCTPSSFVAPNTGVGSGPCRDANGDGFADIIVLASNASSSDGRSGTGALWQFFGNYDRIYEAGSTDNFKRAAGSNFFNTTASCINFGMSAFIPNNSAFGDADRKTCAPTKIIPNSTLAGSRMGLYNTSVAAGDITRDGLFDIVIGATGDSTQGANAGAAFAFTSMRGQGITNNIKKFIRNNGNSSDQLGFAVAVGDFDATEQNQELTAYTCNSEGSGTKCTPENMNLALLPFKDLAVGAPYGDTNRPAGGGVHLFNSGSFVLPAVRTTSDVDIYDSLASLQDFGYGESRIVGDINGDGYSDAVSHIQGYNLSGQKTYDAVVYYGSSLGLVTTQFCLQNQSRVFKNAGQSQECYPSGSHQINITNHEIILPQKLVRPNNVSAGWGRLGWSAGDVNGDGFSDVAFIDPFYDEYNAQILVYYGTRVGLQDVVIPSWRPANNDPQIVTRQVQVPRYWYDTYADFYYDRINLLQAGDFNGDGYSDIAIANPTESGPNLATRTSTREPYGGGLETIKDISAWPTNSVNKDTLWRCPDSTNPSEICVQGRGPRMHGAVFIFYGSPMGVASPSMYTAGATNFDLKTPNIKLNFVYNSEDDFGMPKDQAKAQCSSLAPEDKCIPYATILRNPVLANFKNGHYAFEHYFGASTAALKLYKSDKYDTLVVSAPGYEHLNCLNFSDPQASAPQLDQGRIYIFRGSQYGLLAGAKTDYYPEPTDGNTAYCTDMPQANDSGLGFNAFSRVRALRMTIAGTPTNSEQDSVSPSRNSRTRRFGWRLANVGDLNGDGSEDLVVSAPYENVYDQNKTVVRGAGAAYVFYGPICPTDNDSNLQSYIQDPLRLNKQTRFADSNTSIAGSCAGKFLAPQKFRVGDIAPASAGEFSSTNANYGMAIAGGRIEKGKQTGDFNKDGYADFILGSPNWNDVVSSASRVGKGVVFFGSPNGLFSDEFPSTVVEKLSQNRVKPYVIRPPVSINNNQFFIGNVSTGDVNGDQSMDLMVPSFSYDGVNPIPGIDLGAFFLFY